MSDIQDHDEDEREDDLELDAADDNTAPPEDDVEIGFEGEEAGEAGGQELVRHLRAKLTETQAELAKRGPAEPAIVVGPMPTLDDPDVEWDGEKLAQKMEKWVKDKAAAEDQAEQAAAAHNQAGVDIQKDLQAGATRFAEGKKAMARPDFDIAETAAFSTLNDMQQAAILQIADDPAKFVYALGRSAAKLKELAAITNPFKFSAAVQELKGKITMKPKSQGVEPDEPIRGAARMSKGVDKEEQRLEAAADKSGDRSALVAYRRGKNQGGRR